MAGESSRTTHQAPTTIDACRYYAGLILGALTGVSKERLFATHFSPIPGYWEAAPLHPEIDEIAAGSFRRREPPEIKGTAFVVRSMEAALWAFDRSSSFKEGCLKAVNLGNDADTTAAVYGQLAGAFYGESGIPAEWRRKIAKASLIKGFADRLHERLTPQPNR